MDVSAAKKRFETILALVVPNTISISGTNPNTNTNAILQLPQNSRTNNLSALRVSASSLKQDFVGRINPRKPPSTHI